MERRREIGIVGCRLELEDGSLDHAAKRAFPTPLSALETSRASGAVPARAGCLPRIARPTSNPARWTR
jgi:hypothetical protein